MNEYLKPALQGFRLEDGAYLRSLPDEDGTLLSEALGLSLRREAKYLRVVDLKTDEPLLRPDEMADQRKAEAAARRQAERRAQAEIAARLRAEERAQTETAARQQAKAELAQLRAEVQRLRQSSEDPA